MPEDPKKTQQKKGKHDPKEQRKVRTPRQPANLPAEKKPEVPKAPEKPEIPEPGPEFYKNLKHETDEILKITEEAQAKYSKKEIKSNWKKYEVPINSYEDFEEVESMGADYEQLIQAPLSTGGHFQFKHEKSWDNMNASTEYDKYFEPDMATLALGLSSIPFYERNNLDLNVFSQGEITTMKNRANKFKQKLTNDKNLNVPELEINATILKKLGESTKEIEFVEDPPELQSDGDIKDEKVSPIKKVSPENTNLIKDKVKDDYSNKDEKVSVLVKDDLEDFLNVEEREDAKNTDSVMTPEIDFNIKPEPMTTEDSHSAVVQKAKTDAILEPVEDLEQWLDDFLEK